MVSNKSKIKDLKIGDLVTHVLYGKDWIGMILAFREDKESPGTKNEKALVQIQPGTKFEGFFKEKVSADQRETDNSGFITTNWLFKLEIKKCRF